MEIWKDIKGFKGLYQVSNVGNVRSMDRFITRKDGLKRHLKGKLLTQRNRIEGKRTYKTVALYDKNSKRYERNVHTLVALMFIGERPNKYVIDHIDNNPLNNNSENLQYITNRENCIKDAVSSSGFRNIYNCNNRFKVIVSFNRKAYYIGIYDSLEEAVNIRDMVEKNRELFNGCIYTFRNELNINTINNTSSRIRT